jgi:hypothetical protein
LVVFLPFAGYCCTQRPVPQDQPILPYTHVRLIVYLDRTEMRPIIRNIFVIRARSSCTPRRVWECAARRGGGEVVLFRQPLLSPKRKFSPSPLCIVPPNPARATAWLHVKNNGKTQQLARPADALTMLLPNLVFRQALCNEVLILNSDFTHHVLKLSRSVCDRTPAQLYTTCLLD